MNMWFREQYMQLDEQSRRALLTSLPNRYPAFQFKHFASFARYGVHTESAVYERDDREYVFVPGDRVVLGWDGFVEGQDAATKQEIVEILAEYDVEDSDAYLRETMSPLRQAVIHPMLVERRLRGIGWRQVSLEDERLQAWQNKISSFANSPNNMSLTIQKTLRLNKSCDEITAELYESLSLDQLYTELQAEELRLPNEDEWEYLCGGGNRTLWRWGDSFNFDMRIRHFDAEETSEKVYELEKMNGFGLQMAYDPYRYEIVDAPCLFKGADGGSNICGGLGLVLGYLPVATFFRDQSLDEEMKAGFREDIGGDYTFYRTVYSLE